MKTTSAIFALALVFALIPDTGRASVVHLADAAIESSVGPQTDNFSFTGTTVGGPTFNRPLANGNAAPTALSGVGTAVAYSTYSFIAPSTGSYTFLSQSVTPANWDNYTVLYQTTFNAASPLTNALIANDDNPTIGLSGFSISLTGGTSYIFVTCGFTNTDAGSFNDSIITPVPEPGTYVWAVAGLTGLCLLRRVRRAS